MNRWVGPGAHRDMVRGVRWLGDSPRVVTFSSEKVSGGFCNTLLLTDVRARASTPFREVQFLLTPALPISRELLPEHMLM